MFTLVYLGWLLVAKPKAGPSNHKKAKKIENWPWGERRPLWPPPLGILLISLNSVYRGGWRWSPGALDLHCMGLSPADGYLASGLMRALALARPDSFPLFRDASGWRRSLWVES